MQPPKSDEQDILELTLAQIIPPPTTPEIDDENDFREAEGHPS